MKRNSLDLFRLLTSASYAQKLRASFAASLVSSPCTSGGCHRVSFGLAAALAAASARASAFAFAADWRSAFAMRPLPTALEPYISSSSSSSSSSSEEEVSSGRFCGLRVSSVPSFAVFQGVPSASSLRRSCVEVKGCEMRLNRNERRY